MGTTFGTNEWFFVALMINALISIVGFGILGIGMILHWIDTRKSPIQTLADHLARCVAEGQCPAVNSRAHVVMEYVYFWPIAIFGRRAAFVTFGFALLTIGYPIFFDQFWWGFTGKKLFFPENPDKSIR